MNNFKKISAALLVLFLLVAAIAPVAIAATDAKVQPGETAIVSNTYALRSDSPVEVELQEGWGDAVVGCVFA